MQIRNLHNERLLSANRNITGTEMATTTRDTVGGREGDEKMQVGQLLGFASPLPTTHSLEWFQRTVGPM